MTFLIAWHFPNRTPERCGWEAAEGKGKTWLSATTTAKRFPDAWEVSRYVARELRTLEARSQKIC